MEDTKQIDYKLVNKIDLAFNVRAASRVVTQVYDNALKGLGISSTQFSLLGAIEWGDMASVTELSNRLKMERSTLSRGLFYLCHYGFIENYFGKDRRYKIYRLTEKGKKTLESAVLLWDQLQFKIISLVGRERYHELLSELETLSDVLENSLAYS